MESSSAGGPWPSRNPVASMTWQALAENCLAGLAVFDGRQYRLKWANRRFHQLLGQGDADCTGRELGVIFPRGEDVAAIARRAATTGQPQDVPEFWIRDMPGGAVCWHLSIHALGQAEGPPEIAVQLVVVGERPGGGAESSPGASDHLSGQRATAERDRLLAILEATPDIVATATPDQRIFYINRAARRLLGVGEDFAPSQLTVADGYPPQVNEFAQTVAIPAAMRDGVWCGEMALRRGDGGEFPISEVILVHKAPDGTPEYFSTICRDITQQKQLEETLRQREEWLHQALHAGRSFAFEWDPGTDRAVLLGECNEILGLPGETPREGVGREFFSRVYPEDRERNLAHLETLTPLADRYRMMCRYLRQDGQTAILEETGRGLFDPEGRLVRVIGLVTDVTERERAAQALRESETRLALALEAVGAAWWEFDPIRQTPLWSPEMYELRGFDPQQPLTFPGLIAAVAPADREQLQQRLSEALQGDQNVASVEFRVLHPVRGIRWMVAFGKILRDDSGRPVRIVGIDLDITERKEAEQKIAWLNEELQRKVKDLRTILDTAPINIAIAEDPGCRTVRGNAFLARAFPVPAGIDVWPSSLSNLSPLIHFYRDGRELATEELPLQMAARGQSVSNIEMDLRLANGTVVTVLGNAAPLMDDRGQPRGAVAAFIDISDLKRTQRELCAARLAADKASLAKSQFLANMGHEFRTPMTAVLGMTELALNEELSPAVREYLRIVHGSATLLLCVLNESLDVSRIEAAKMSLECGPFRLRSSIAETFTTLARQASAKGLQLLWEVAAEVPDGLAGDSSRLRQILLNLVGNAIKFTEVGRVTLRVTLDSAAEDRAVLRFAVVDTGIGISPEAQKRLLAPFTQTEHVTPNRFGRSGLGLTISASLVTLMGGRVWLESQLGHGSTIFFTVELPIRSDA